MKKPTQRNAVKVSFIGWRGDLTVGYSDCKETYVGRVWVSARPGGGGGWWVCPREGMLTRLHEIVVVR